MSGGGIPGNALRGNRVVSYWGVSWLFWFRLLAIFSLLSATVWLQVRFLAGSGGFGCFVAAVSREYAAFSSCFCAGSLLSSAVFGF
jgi:hypothetical protein